MKQCTSCKEWKPFKCFWENKRNRDGFCVYCKQCATLRHRAWLKSQTRAARAQEAHRTALAARAKREHLAAVRKEVCQTFVATDHDFLLDLHTVLIEAMFLRGRKNPFARIQFQEIGRWDEDPFSTDL